MRRSAFTLAESMMALLISMVTVLALGQTIKIVDQVNQRALDMPTDWYLFVTELELSDRHFSLYRCQDEQHAATFKQLGRQRLEIEVKRSNGYRQTAVICLAPSQKQYSAGGDDHAEYYDSSRFGSVSISGWPSKTDSSS